MGTAPPTPSRTAKLQRLFGLAASQAGYFTAAEARELGYTPRSLVHHVEAGHFERVSRGFYRLHGVPGGPHEDIVAAWLKVRRRRAIVSHDTALALYELAPSRSREIHLMVPRELRPRTPQRSDVVKLHTTSAPLRRDEVTSRFGVRLTSPARTIVDVAHTGTDPSVVVEAVDHALSTGLVSADELRAASEGRSARVRNLVERALAEAGVRA
jgi:predicted transcriptional regulator of viral defense system